jgi:FdhD protein
MFSGQGMEPQESQSSEPELKGLKFAAGTWQESPISVPVEFNLTLFINSRELVTIMCTPVKLNCLVLGYLYSEGIIQNLKEVTSMRVCEDDAVADVVLERQDFVLPEKRILTSGCGGGISFNNKIAQISSNLTINPENILLLMRKMLENAASYNLTGGIHTSVICDSSGIIAMAEDIGRHNTIDKLTGECLLRKIATKDKVLLTSGRISSEMLRKAAAMQVPVLVSLTSPTERAVRLAEISGMTLVGYARGDHLTVYANPKRLQSAST